MDVFLSFFVDLKVATPSPKTIWTVAIGDRIDLSRSTGKRAAASAPKAND